MSLRGRLRDPNGSALLPVLAVLLVISLIFTSIVFYGAWHKLKAQRVYLKIKAEYLAEAGVNRAIWYLSGNGGKDIHWRPSNESVETTGNSSCSFSVSNWGGYLLVESAGKAGAVQRRVRALIGQKPDDYFNRAINLGDPAYPLVVTGSNRIVGDVLVGPAGVLEGKYKGEGFFGPKAVIGNILSQSNTEFPAISDWMLEEFKKTVRVNRENAIKQDCALTIDDHTENDFLKSKKLSVSGNIVITSQAEKLFYGPGFLHSEGNITISGNVNLDSNLILVAEDGISVTGQSQIRDCILNSKSAIILGDRCGVQGQIISDGDIVVEYKAIVKYPSFLSVRGKARDKKIEGELSLQTQELVEGILLYYDDSISNQLALVRENRGIISVSKDTKFKGVILSTNRTRQEGIVSGNITTGTFYFSSPPTEHVNWLRNSLTDRTALRREMILPLIFDGQPKLEIADYRVLN